ncbi:MAG: oligopeptide/dipeptide ABC transporter ATP-binding protein, partial [Planctomycetota bacterium]
PKHPYTEALLRAVPRLDETVHEKLTAIEGMPPQLDRPFVACPFEPRCSLREERCGSGVPDLVPYTPDRAHACRVRQGDS